ncbi:hypothetical protein DPEC_G00118970 [Dallia pectoralis]|uniref:Uncharacterized protein n=1 Tax=Dallia pectoralis TaxID=75939 RepID=A0ACC2GPF2_DALPE|nr:hypothetical protein DPEC_G00118970 [Dallia pectoralis]
MELPFSVPSTRRPAPEKHGTLFCLRFHRFLPLRFSGDGLGTARGKGAVSLDISGNCFGKSQVRGQGHGDILSVTLN